MRFEDEEEGEIPIRTPNEESKKNDQEDAKSDKQPSMLGRVERDEEEGRGVSSVEDTVVIVPDEDDLSSSELRRVLIPLPLRSLICGSSGFGILIDFPFSS